MLPFIIAGLASGSIFGLAGLGLVLTFKTSGLFNFAHGAVAVVGAYLFYELHVLHHVPWPVAAVVTVLVAGLVFGLLLERLATALLPLGTVAQVMGTIGLLLAVQGLAAARYGTTVRNFPPFLPASTFDAFGVRVGWDQLITAVVAAAGAAALFLFLRNTRSGVAMRGVVDDPTLLALSGTNPKRVRRGAWMIGTCVAAASGVLIAPTLGLDAILLTLLVVQAFGAAAIGRFDSLVWTYLGGLAIGVVGAISTRYVGDFSLLAGFRPSLPFLVLFVALLVRRPVVATSGQGDVGRRSSRPSTLSLPKLGGIGLACLAVLLVVPQIVGDDLYLYTKGLTFVVIFMSLGLLVWTSGQVSLAHAAFAGVGAATFSHLAVGLGVPWPVALVATGLVAVPIAAIIAIPAIRLSGIYLALATMGFSLLMQYLFFGTNFMFGIAGNRKVPRPAFGGPPVGDTGFYYIVLAVVVLTTITIMAVHRTRLGRSLRALADSQSALAALGTDVRLPLVLVFCLTGFFAAVAGALFGAATGTISASGFSVFDSLTWLVVLALVGRSVVPAAFLAAFVFVIAPNYTPGVFADNQTLIFGVSAMVGALAMGRRPGAIRAWLRASVAGAQARAAHSPIRSRSAGLA